LKFLQILVLASVTLAVTAGTVSYLIGVVLR